MRGDEWFLKGFLVCVFSFYVSWAIEHFYQAPITNTAIYLTVVTDDGG